MLRNRTLVWLGGALTLAVALALALDIVSSVRADPAPPPCPDQSPDQSSNACWIPTPGSAICSGQTQANCPNPAFNFFEVLQDFPKCARNVGFVCNLPLANCYRSCSCTWDATKTPPCQTVQKPNALWIAQPKPTDGGACAT
jgi:hypothetical protein